MKKIISFIVLLFLCASLSACYTTRVGPGGDPMSGSSVKSFTRTVGVPHFIYGLVQGGNSAKTVQDVIDEEVKAAGGAKASNVRYTFQQSFVDGLLGGITLGIYTPISVTIEGDVVK